MLKASKFSVVLLLGFVILSLPSSATYAAENRQDKTTKKETVTSHLVGQVDDRALIGLRHFTLTIDTIHHFDGDYPNMTLVHDENAEKPAATAAELELRIAGIVFEDRPYIEPGRDWLHSLPPNAQPHDVPCVFVKIDPQEFSGRKLFRQRTTINAALPALRAAL
jgi:hypothetical protein